MVTSETVPLVRAARREDAGHLARFVHMASEGLVRRIWEEMAEEGEDFWAVGRRRAARDEGAFSWRNAAVAEVRGEIAGGLVTYPIGDEPGPVEDLPRIFRPLQELENLALGTQYVNVLATYPAFRGMGVGSALLGEVEARAGDRDLSLIVADRNESAWRLYEATGYVERARAPLLTDGWSTPSSAWVLMLKTGPR